MANRRLQVDYERDPEVTQGFIWAAHSRLPHPIPDACGTTNNNASTSTVNKPLDKGASDTPDPGHLQRS